MKISSERTKREYFYTHYFMGVLAYVVISRHFILKLIIWRLSSWKTIIPRISLTCILNHFLINYIRLKLLLKMHLKEMFLLSCRPWGSTSFQIRKKLQKLFSDKLTSFNLKIVFMSPVRVKSFFIFTDKLPMTLLSGLVYNCKCGGCKLPIMVRPNAILKFEFVNI